jgi:electron transfer flavoprotein-quinone oxidoreductase
MADDKFAAVIVGAGPAGSTAAYLLAKAGLEVLLIERASEPGGKNMFGGRLYSYSLHRIMPDFWEQAPVERRVVRETLSLMAGDKTVSVSCQDKNWEKTPYHSFTLLRAEFDAWMAAQAEAAGAMVAPGIRVDGLIMENGRVIGVRAGDDELLADVVIAADGANSLLAEQAGLGKRPGPHQVAVGVKQVIELSPEVIDQRFQLSDGRGAASLYVGSCTRGMPGGGFLYTNKSSLSLGLVVKASEFETGQYRVSELLEDFKEQPAIAPLIEGGRVGEYSAHLVPEAGLGMAPKLFGDGILVAGDAAGLVLNLGYLVRGMDLAIASGEAAALAVEQARAAGDYSRSKLSVYQGLLQSGVLRDMEQYRRAPGFLEHRRIYQLYPELAAGLASELFTVDGSPPVSLWKKGMRCLKRHQVGWTQLMKDAWTGGKSL